MDLRGRKIIVVGLGSSGEAAARISQRSGAEVWVTESGTGPEIEARAERLRGLGMTVETGRHTFHDVDADTAIVSPGIPPSAPILRHLRDHGVRAIGEVELAYRLTNSPLIAVTGTNGKTTTTALLRDMLEESGRSAVAAGNIGTPLVDVAVRRDEATIVAEVSSFQLAAIETFRPRVAVILNIAEDHIDWHGSLEAYAQAKGRIFENQDSDDVVLYNAEDRIVKQVVATAGSRRVPFSATRRRADGIGVEGDLVVWRGRNIFSKRDVPMAGTAGLEDAVAAAGAALEFGADLGAVVRALKGFRPLPHRLQVIARRKGIDYIDDSKATNPHATLAAVRGLENVVLIAGGRSKGIDLAPLRAVAPPVIAVIALGEAAEEIERVFAHQVPVERADDMHDAVELARARSTAPGSVLLAPACASLDMYESYAARGEAFARAVKELVGDRDERREDGDA